MNATRDVSPLGAMILLRLLTSPEKDRARGALYRSLKPLLEQRWSNAEQRTVVDDEIAALESKGQIARGNKTRLVVTDAGQRAALATLGATTLPKGGWRVVKKHLLASTFAPPGQVAKVPSKNALDADRLVGTILDHHHGLDAGEHPTLLQAVDALVWKALGGEPGRPVTPSAIRALFLRRALDILEPKESGKNLHEVVQKLAGQLAAKSVKARRTDARSLELAVFRDWLEGAPAASDLPPVKPAPIGNDDDFARRVVTAARATKTGRFGEDKVFISHVFRRLVSEGAVPDDARSFKDRLISAHRDDRLTLSRADLVGAMDPRDVDSSEASYLGATFHFIHV